MRQPEELLRELLSFMVIELSVGAVEQFGCEAGEETRDVSPAAS